MPAAARFTRAAYEKLAAELDALKQKRNEVRLDVKETREQGDLRENFPYHAAREQQGILEARITGLEARLNGADIIEAGETMDEVMLGVPVTVKIARQRARLYHCLARRNGKRHSQRCRVERIGDWSIADQPQSRRNR